MEQVYTPTIPLHATTHNTLGTHLDCYLLSPPPPSVDLPKGTSIQRLPHLHLSIVHIQHSPQGVGGWGCSELAELNCGGRAWVLVARRSHAE